MKHNEDHAGDLIKFITQNFPLETFNDVQKNLNKEKDDSVENLNLDFDIESFARERTTVSVNLNDGYKFRFLRKLTTEIKDIESTEIIKK